MFRQSPARLNWRAKYELQRVRRYLPGRAKHEFKRAHMFVMAKLKNETENRLMTWKQARSSVRTVNVDAAAREQGATARALGNDLARQNVALNRGTLRRLALYEPLSFRAVCELGSSAIAPPLSADELAQRQHRLTAGAMTTGTAAFPAAPQFVPFDSNPATVARRDLLDDVRRMKAMSGGSSSGWPLSTVSDDVLVDSWKAFVCEGDLARVTSKISGDGGDVTGTQSGGAA